MKQYVALEKETLHGDNGVPTYFIDVITTDQEGRQSNTNLRAVKNITEARTIARAEATKRGLPVEDDTLEPKPVLEPELRPVR